MMRRTSGRVSIHLALMLALAGLVALLAALTVPLALLREGRVVRELAAPIV